MTNDLNYVPIIKTGDAEIKGFLNLSEKTKDSITPLFELTRYRKIRIKKEKQVIELPLDKRIDKIEEAFGKNRAFFLDLTDDEKLSNERIRDFQNSKSGYSKWCQYLIDLKKRFSKIIPVLQVSDEGSDTIEEAKTNLKKQVEFLSENFNIFLYRFPISDQNYKEDLSDIISSSERSKIICCIDMTFMRQEQGIAEAQRIYNIIQTLNDGDYRLSKFIVSGTSYPYSQDIKDDYSEFALEEVKLFNEIQKLNKSNLNIYYSDYACINPNRTDVMARGWIPKIDYPDKETLFLHRKRKGNLEYAVAYCEVAKLMAADKKYQNVRKQLEDEGCWGIKQIDLTSSGIPAGLSPSFWISVRLNLAITLRANVLSQISNTAS
jgi:hypothetical protein